MIPRSSSPGPNSPVSQQAQADICPQALARDVDGIVPASPTSRLADSVSLEAMVPASDASLVGRVDYAQVAVPQPKAPSLRRAPFLWLKYVTESTGLRRGNTLRRASLDSIMDLVQSDFAEWSAKEKTSRNARVFIGKCIANLRKINPLIEEHEFMKSVSQSDAQRSTSEERDFAEDVTSTREKLSYLIEEAVLETDLSVYLAYSKRLQDLLQQQELVDQHSITTQLDKLRDDILKDGSFLSDTSSKALEAKMKELEGNLEELRA